MYVIAVTRNVLDPDHAVVPENLSRSHPSVIPAQNHDPNLDREHQDAASDLDRPHAVADLEADPILVEGVTILKN